MNYLHRFGIWEASIGKTLEIPAFSEEGKTAITVDVTERGVATAKCVILRGSLVMQEGVFIGRTPAALTVEYEDGTKDAYELTVGESLWFGDRFGKYPEPLTSDPVGHAIFADLFRLLPLDTVTDTEGYYLALELTEGKTVRRIRLEKTERVNLAFFEAYFLGFVPGVFEPVLLQKRGVDAGNRAAKLRRLTDLLYSSERNFPEHTVPETPDGGNGQPVYRFSGDKYAEFYTNVMNFNLADMRRKVEESGYCHTSTLGAPWYGYDGIGGTYTNESRIYSWQKPGMYYAECWTRDMGRILMEQMRFGVGTNVRAGLDWLIGRVRHWEDPDAPKLEGVTLPRHFQRIVQRFELGVGNGCFENDGHALCCTAIWMYWKRSKDSAWLREHAEDILAFGGWYEWQFENPALSKATDVLWSDSESSGWPMKTGLSFYVDEASAAALVCLAELADELGESESAGRWRALAARMRKTAEKYYLGEWEGQTCWCRNESWDPQTSLAHIILSSDHGSLYLPDHDPAWVTWDRIAQHRNRTRYIYGAAMGYVQAFTIQAALLEDDMEHAAYFMRHCALMIHQPFGSRYLIPESTLRVSDGMYTRMGDLGNGVQQAEILKCLRIVVGIDDMGDVLTLIPRLPDGWTGCEVTDFPLVMGGEKATVSFSYERTETAATLSFRSDRPIPGCRVRLGAFPEDFAPTDVTVNGEKVSVARVELCEGKKWLWLDLPATGTVGTGTVGISVNVR